mmetsp:Transcript_11354/g.13519  ORF Transcript_11354/g.13519 Transcript_11354/m.13519 type:complete len:167 (+) Transcript_11354:78-578(+)|eukprot:jgi/Bigna1/89601/estExt_fgenesh1_pg.C_520059
MGASKGKLALESALKSAVEDGKMSSENFGDIFEGYVGKADALMDPFHLQRLFRDIVQIQKKAGEAIYKKGLQLYQSTPEYKRMGFMERSVTTASIAVMKTTIFTAFTVASDFYTNITNIKAVHSKFSPDGRVTKEVFMKAGPGIILSELGKHHLIVAGNIFEKMSK